MKKQNGIWQGGSKRTLHSGLYASVLAAVVLAVVVLLNLVVRALPTKYTQYDISTTALFTLSDTTENLLHELNTDVTAYYLAESGQEDANITRLLDRYAGESSHFSWQQRDPVLYPTFAQQYDGASTGSAVNWLNGAQTTAVINAKSMSAASLNVPVSAAVPLGVLFTLVLPIVCLIAGAVICVVRRRR